MTPLVSDWHLLRPKGGISIVAVPLADKASGTWTIEIRPVGVGPGHVKEPPRRTYARGKGESVFTREPIPADWIKAKLKRARWR
jgi:putative DNA methylase